MKDLTARQEAILSYIKESLQEKGFPPTLREIGDFFGIKSTNGVNDHLVALEKKGYIKRNKDLSRAIEIVGFSASEHKEDSSVIALPLLGNIAAGLPLLAEENIEDTFKIDRSLIGTGGTLFALRVKGDSMLGDGILDGDYVVIEKGENYNAADIFAVLVDDEVTLKRIVKRPQEIELLPSNPAMRPIFIKASDGKNVAVLGKMRALFRLNK